MRYACVLLLLVACGSPSVDDIDTNAEGDVPASIFRNIGRRTVLQPQSMAQNTIDVATEDELIAALTTLPAETGDCYGKAISIVDDVQFTQTIELAQQHSGLRITSPSRARLTSTVALDRLFFVAARDVLLDGLFFDAGMSATAIVEGSDTFNSRNLTVRDCVLHADAAVSRFVVPAIGIGFGLRVERNSVTSTTAAVLLYGPVGSGASGQGADVLAAAIVDNVGFGGGIAVAVLNDSVVSRNVRIGPIVVDGSTGSGGGNMISNNYIDAAPGTGILIDNDGFNVISGNNLGGGDIDTTGSVGAGGNSIVGNVNVNTITATGTDAVTSNT